MLIILCNFLKMKPSRLEEREWFDHNSLIIEKWGGGEWEEQDKENWQKLYAWGKQLLKISYQKIDQGKNGLKTNTQTKRPEVKTKITKNICGNQGGNWCTMGPEQKQGGGGTSYGKATSNAMVQNMVPSYIPDLFTWNVGVISPHNCIGINRAGSKWRHAMMFTFLSLSGTSL